MFIDMKSRIVRIPFLITPSINVLRLWVGKIVNVLIKL